MVCYVIWWYFVPCRYKDGEAAARHWSLKYKWITVGNITNNETFTSNALWKIINTVSSVHQSVVKWVNRWRTRASSTGSRVQFTGEFNNAPDVLMNSAWVNNALAPSECMFQPLNDIFDKCWFCAEKRLLIGVILREHSRKIPTNSARLKASAIQMMAAVHVCSQ